MNLKQLTFSLITFSIALVFGPKAVEAATLTTIVDGISNARGASFGPDGTLYVGEPGIGGDGNCQPSPSTLFQPICAGNTGSIVKVTPDGRQKRIFQNFQSLAEQPSGNQGAGPQELLFDSQGDAYLLTGFAGYPGNRDLELNTLGQNYELPPGQLVTFPPSPPDEVLNTSNLAKLFQVDLETEELSEIFDFGRYEIMNNPDRGDVVTNPYDFTISGDTAYVVDGGGNVAYKVNLDGSGVEAIPLPKKLIDNPVFPPLPPGAEIPPGLVEVPPDGLPTTPGGLPTQALVQSVPTGGTIGPDGALYVGEYLGFPYPAGEARIFRIGEDNQPEVFLEGFSNITDLTFDEDGNLLVLQFSDVPQFAGDLTSLPGSLIQVAPDGTRTTLVAAGQGLESADGVVVGSDGEIYVTNRGVGPNRGSVVRVNVDDVGGVASVPEPSSILGLLTFSVLGGGAWLKRKSNRE
ncbi:ScyD/ScyE family protein [Candidatus Gracilibacteria bacterium]|nr:ScyD/ScyE family protein [Candidatus Gracilibacteria bacterium]NJP21213.1 ScyD/ScyE family protein [Hydrococcus sp. CRU_1_1]